MRWRVRWVQYLQPLLPSPRKTFHKLAPSSSDEGNSRTGRNFFHSAKLCFKVSVSSAAGAPTFPEAQRIVSWVFGHRCSIFPVHFIAPARHELGTTLPINPRSNFARFSDGIPPLLDDCQLQVKKMLDPQQWMDELGLVEKWPPGWVPGSQAVALLAASPQLPVGRGGGAWGWQQGWQGPVVWSRLLPRSRGWGCQPAETNFPRTR